MYFFRVAASINIHLKQYLAVTIDTPSVAFAYHLSYL